MLTAVPKGAVPGGEDEAEIPVQGCVVSVYVKEARRSQLPRALRPVPRLLLSRAQMPMLYRPLASPLVFQLKVALVE